MRVQEVGPDSLPRKIDAGRPNAEDREAAGTGGNRGHNAADHQGLKNLGRCVEEFSKGPLTQYQQTLNEWDAVFSALQTAPTANETERAATVKGAITKIDGLLGRTKEFDTKGRAFYADFEQCPNEVKSAFEVLTTPPAGK